MSNVLSLAHKAVRAELLVGARGRRPLGWPPWQLAVRDGRGRQRAGRRPSPRFAPCARKKATHGDGQAIEQVVQCDLSELLLESVHWLARRQNPDGGWGDCEGARSNIAATMMVQAAFRLTGIPAKYADLMDRADDYVEAEGGLAALTPPLQWRQNPAGRDHGQLCAGRHGHMATSADAATRIGLPADALAAQHPSRSSRAMRGRSSSPLAEPSSITIRPRIRFRACCAEAFGERA